MFVRFATGSALGILLATSTLAQQGGAARVLRNGTDGVVFLRYSPDGHYLARICQTGPVAIFDTASYKKVRSFDVGMRMVAWNPAATLLATAEGTDGARVWNAAAEGDRASDSRLHDVDEIRVLRRPTVVLAAPGLPRTQAILWTEFSPDGSRLVTVSASGVLKIYRTDKWSNERDINVGQELRSAAFHPQDGTIYVGDMGSTIHVYDVVTGEEKASLKAPAPVIDLVMAPNGKTFATLHEGRALVWSIGRPTATVKPNVTAAAYSRDGKTLVLASRSLEFVDPESPQSGRTVALEHMSLAEANPRHASLPYSDRKFPIAVMTLDVSPDGKTLAVGLFDTSTRLLNWPD